MNNVPSVGHSSKVAGVRRKRFEIVLGVVGFEPRTPSLEYMCMPTRVQSTALMRTGHRCINSVLVNVLTKGQGGAILPMKDTNLQELEKIENVTHRE